MTTFVLLGEALFHTLVSGTRHHVGICFFYSKTVSGFSFLRAQQAALWELENETFVRSFFIAAHKMKKNNLRK